MEKPPAQTLKQLSSVTLTPQEASENPIDCERRLRKTVRGVSRINLNEDGEDSGSNSARRSLTGSHLRNKQSRPVSFWTLDENIAYTTFLRQKTKLFQEESHRRRQVRVYVLMSKAVGTRSSDQCRSHHQKMMKYHSNLQGIIQHVKALQEKRKQAQRVNKIQQEGEDYRWLQCVNWIEWHQERWEEKQAEQHAEGLHDVL